MRFTLFKNTLFLLVFICFSCGSGVGSKNESKDSDQLNEASNPRGGIQADQTNEHKGKTTSTSNTQSLLVGADRMDLYIPMLQGKKVGVVANQTSVIFNDNNKLDNVSLTRGDEYLHLVDALVENKIAVTAVFAPEHGFRGKADAGELLKDGIDTKTGLPIISLYGKSKKPSKAQLSNIDVMVFDIQDVGARFYTYISSLHYIMEACAEQKIPLIVLDRPNPNGHYIDGPILQEQHKSFIGMHAVPVVHGMTIGEYALMINGQNWLKNGIECKLKVIEMSAYNRHTPYGLAIKPSPNLPNDVAINLYPSLCFFEGTVVSAGRGTQSQFQVFGAPSLPKEFFPFQFTPRPNEGAKYPKFNGEVCNGLDLRNSPTLNKLNLEWLIEAYVGYGKKPDFFSDFFTKLAGTTELQQQIEQGYTYREIRKTWLEGLKKYDKMRQPYLLYK